MIDSMTQPALIVLTRQGLILANRLRPHLGSSHIHTYSPGLGHPPEADYSFDDTGAYLRDLFARKTPIIGLCSTGIIIRSLAGCLRDKWCEPPVLALAEDGSVVIPLLGAHHGGLTLARCIATATKGILAATTASDIQGLPAIDQPPAGWHIGNREAAKGITAAILNHQPVALTQDVSDGGWLSQSDLRFDPQSTHRIIITPYQHFSDHSRREDPLLHDDSLNETPQSNHDANTAFFHPPVLTIGVGCERGTDGHELITLIEECLHGHHLAPEAIACLCSLDIKMDEEAVHHAAAHFGRPVRFFDAGRLEKERPRLVNPSEDVYRTTGCHGVCEGAALAAAGTKGQLLCPKTKSHRSTCAIALAGEPLDVESIGSQRGRLTVIGLGPGSPDWMPPETRRALADAQDLIGYHLYLDQAASLAPQAQRHDFELGEETQRAKVALDQAASGRRVALVSSGDAGIYAMASLVFEMRHQGPPRWWWPELEVLPGITAMQAAAARAGAPLGHDFCALSLSDLLTPWSIIRRRLEAAASSDFVVALYNPVSKKRNHQLAQARDIFLAHRPATTPVILARNLGRSGDHSDVIPLDQLSPEKADMQTLVIIGNSQTRQDKTGAIYTPRGYPVPSEDTRDTRSGDTRSTPPSSGVVSPGISSPKKHHGQPRKSGSGYNIT